MLILVLHLVHIRKSADVYVSKLSACVISTRVCMSKLAEGTEL